MSIITEARLTAFLPTLPNVAIWARALDEAMERFEINTPERMAAFLAQIAPESGEFRRLVESLNYTGSRLMKVWPKRFQTLEKANEYARQPEKLANYVYAKRLGNRDVASGDGWRYRGRGRERRRRSARPSICSSKVQVPGSSFDSVRGSRQRRTMNVEPNQDPGTRFRRPART
jgi:predicted chitinase